jgi:hypothetical protein
MITEILAGQAFASETDRATTGGPAGVTKSGAGGAITIY